MCDPTQEENTSTHSDDSIILLKNENFKKLEELVNMEAKHSSVYYDLHSKNSVLKVDLENLCNSCKRFDNKKKTKSDILEEFYEKLVECQKHNKLQLQEKLSSVMKKLEETNSHFSKAFDDYSNESLKSSMELFDNKTQQMEKEYLKTVKKLDTVEQESKITESLMNPIFSQPSSLDIVINELFEFSMKRPQIELEDTGSKLAAEIKKLEQKREDIKSIIKKHSK